jgi:hypothetical protein
MLNPLLKHPILQHLPYNDLKNPTIDGIKVFVVKRRKNLNRLSVLLAGCGISNPVLSWLLFEKINWDQAIFSILLLVISVAMRNEANKSHMTDEEIVSVIIQKNNS